jgi:hypothetical protein
MQRSESLIAVWTKQANAHAKDHQGGTLVSIVVAIIGWATTVFGLSVPPWASTVGLLMFLGMLGSWSAWRTANDKAEYLEKRLLPSLIAAAASENPDSIADNKWNGAAYPWHRLVVHNESDVPIKGCFGTVTDIYLEGVSTFSEPIDLPFTRSYLPDAFSKTIVNGVPAFWDVIVTTADNRVFLATKDLLQVEGKTPEQMFPRVGEYIISYVISSDGPARIKGKLKFFWAGNTEDSRLELS